jgi:uncharacterized 2Fe-2S/4Fe-4S cluster protein (DUF4445 family)
VPVTFEPAGVVSWVQSGATVLEAARAAGIVVAAPCGGRGVCGACGVRVIAGTLSAPDEAELAGLKRARSDIRLACRARVLGAATIRPLAVTPRPEPMAGEAHTTGYVPLVAGVDLGTTSIAAALIDPSTGRELARSSVPNPQQSYGADILSRLSAAIAGDAAELCALAEQGILAALWAAAERAEVSTSWVDRLVIAGNTAMMALLVRADTTSLAVHPFVPPEVGEVGDESAIREALGDGAGIELLPSIAGFVGGDALAATLSAGMVDAERPTLLVDFGTNAEVVLAGAGSLVVASAAAGPAFEGVGVSCGGPAAAGAVIRTRIGDDGSIALEVMGSDAPAWFSGSGLVSAIAELRRCGHIDASGLMHEEGPLSRKFSKLDNGVLTVSFRDRVEGCLSLNQLDVRALQLAKAAVRVAIQSVLKSASVSASEIESVMVAGAFGSALCPEDLVELGVLPSGVAAVTRAVGNAALEGAAIVALEPSVLGLARQAAHDARHVDLAADATFARSLLEATEFEPYFA